MWQLVMHGALNVAYLAIKWKGAHVLIECHQHHYSDSIEQAQLYYDHSFGKVVVLMESAEALQEIAYIVSDETLAQVFHSV